MYKYFKNRFGGSTQEGKDIRTATLLTLLLDLSYMLPIMVAFIFLKDYINNFFEGLAINYGLLFYLLLSLAFFLVMMLISYFQYNACYVKIYGEGAQRRIRLAEILRKLPLSFFSKKDIADLSSTIMQDVTELEQMFSHAIPQFYGSALFATLISIMTIVYNWKLGIAIFWVIPFSLLVFILGKRKIKKGFETTYKMRRKISDEIQEGLELIQEIKSYQQEETYLNNFDKTLNTYEKQLVKSELFAGTFINLAHVFLKLGMVTTAVLGGYLLSKGEIKTFEFICFLIVSSRIYDPITEVLSSFGAVLYLDEKISRMKELDTMRLQEGKNEFTPKNFDIEFKDVNFSYEEDVQTITGADLVAKQGEVTALVGPSGGGKTTIAKLAARFWDIDSGTITIGGEDISKVDPEALLKHFSIVFQDVTLFNASVMENIRLGKKDASDDEVMKVAKLAQCDEFIKKLPEGYATLIGENGAKLSGGERQRLSIARALLKDAPIILLDEATASIDVENESKIQVAISELIKNKTVLIIAHRMRTVADADKIVVIENGIIKEMGSPKELQNQNGLFAKMCKNQMSS